MANVWIAIDGFAEVETDQENVITNPETGEGYVILRRREVFVTVYERHSHNPSFVFGSGKSEVTLLGDPEATLVVRHGWRKSPITGKVLEFKEVHEPGKWKKAGTYILEQIQPPEPE